MAKKGKHHGKKRSAAKKSHKARGNKRPLKFLKQMETKMSRNLPRLRKIISDREARGER